VGERERHSSGERPNNELGLFRAIEAAPRGSGGDDPEALEDTIQPCRLQAEELCPATHLVLTDAPPNSEKLVRARSVSMTS
jgi:hypothetical protein